MNARILWLLACLVLLAALLSIASGKGGGRFGRGRGRDREGEGGKSNGPGRESEGEGEERGNGKRRKGGLMSCPLCKEFEDAFRNQMDMMKERGDINPKECKNDPEPGMCMWTIKMTVREAMEEDPSDECIAKMNELFSGSAA